MKSLLFFLMIVFSISIFSQDKYVILIHGGAGFFPKDTPEKIQQDYLKSLKNALLIGGEILKAGGSSLDAVEKVVNYLEDDSLFNSGRGAVLNEFGEAELDASIMNGKDLTNGAVANVKTIKNPISLARKVMENTKHSLLISDGAEKFGENIGITIVDNQYFKTENNIRRWQKQRDEQIKGTVGAVALDIYGNLASATSTGGMMMKMKGRVGDSPIIGAGTYADNNTCAVSSTGKGEQFIKHSVAIRISALMEYKNYSLTEAVKDVFTTRLEKGDGGVIAVDKYGNYVLYFNTDSMFRGVLTSEIAPHVEIW